MAVGILMVFFQVQPPDISYLILQFLFPLGGIFNILIYTRPATRVLQKRLSISWVKAFWLVVFNGGDTHDLSQDERSSSSKPNIVPQEHEESAIPISYSLGPEANISFGDRDFDARLLNLSSTGLVLVDEGEMNKDIQDIRKIEDTVDGNNTRRRGLMIINDQECTEVSNHQQHDIEGGDHNSSDSLRLVPTIVEIKDFFSGLSYSNNHSDLGGGVSTADSIDKH